MNYGRIIPYDIANGEGIRTSLFVSGCEFHCPDCFNQESQNYDYGEEFTSLTMAEIIESISDPKVDGLSILGGDPLWQSPGGITTLIDLCHRVHDLGKTIWIWSGFTWEEIFPTVAQDFLNVKRVYQQELISNCDVWVDGRFEKDKKDLRLKWRGSSNQRVIDVQKSLETGDIVLYAE